MWFHGLMGTSAASRCKSQWLTDCRSCADSLQKPVARGIDKRLGIEMMSLKQLLRRAKDGEGDSVEWIDTSVQLAETLTKDMESTYLLGVLRENVYDTMATREAKNDKVRKAEARRARRKARDPAVGHRFATGYGQKDECETKTTPVIS